MPVKMTFKATNGDKKTTTIQNIMGYKVTTCFTPGIGFQDRFYVYLYERVEASVTSSDREKLYISPNTSDGHHPEGQLTIDGDHRTYNFKKIQLNNIHAGVTRRERYRLFEFGYPKNVIDDGQDELIDVKNNTSETVLNVGLLRDDYKAGLSGTEQVLGASSSHSGSSVPIFRFSTLRNKNNSWMKQIVETQLGQRKDENKKMKDFTVSFTRKELKVTRENVRKIYVDESYGEMLKTPLPSLSAILDSIQSDTDLARVDWAAHSPEDLTAHEDNRGFRSYSGERTLETITLVFQQGHYQDVKMV